MNHFILYKNQLPQKDFTFKLLNGYFITFDSEPEQVTFENTTYYISGDFISNKQLLENFQSSNLKSFKGHFYLIRQTKDSLEIYSSFLNILPIYFLSGYTIVSSNFNHIIKAYQKELTVDKKFILECLLFNYGFFNRTFFKEISLLPANTSLSINFTSIHENKVYDTSSLFEPSKEKLSESELADLFIKTSKSYFPDSTTHVAFTGGFDGRTLVSCGLYHKIQFKTFSFGKPENDDVSIPEKNAIELNIPYQSLNLGNASYLEKDYIQSAIDFNQSSVGGNGFIYSHVSYASKKLAKESNYLLAGYFGSELFRALHIEGAVSSEALLFLFNTDDEVTIRNYLLKYDGFEFIHKHEFENEINELILELINYKNNLPKQLTKNQKMYVFVFEEIFRKLFGQSIVAQQEYLIVRTPFLDYEFINELLKTNFAGANADFLTKNPYKRMNGQVVYAHIIKKTNSTILYQKTGKGYRPIDIINKLYLTKLIGAFALKKLKRKVRKENLDNLSIISGDKSSFLNSLLNSNYNALFNTAKIVSQISSLKPYMNEKQRDNILMSAALSSQLNQLKSEIKSNSA
jgi:hypothetical protein